MILETNKRPYIDVIDIRDELDYCSNINISLFNIYHNDSISLVERLYRFSEYASIKFRIKYI